ncbi:EF hand [Aphelenchoides bicaudatus]|nr:EF hand [Aphelenchoides bicaudatus]
MPKGIERIRHRVRVANWTHPNTIDSARGSRDGSHHRGSHSGESIAMSTFNVQENFYDEDELEEYRQLFLMFDTDNSGAIGNDELKKAILSLGHQATDTEIDQLIREVDENGDGEIDFGEFCHCLHRSRTLQLASNEEFVKQCFAVLDQDQNGVISKNEFLYISKEIGGFSDDLAEKIFQQLDVSSNGYLSAGQFNAICADYMLNDQSQLYSG